MQKRANITNNKLSYWLNENLYYYYSILVLF